jgi:hypothetical protein
MEVVSEGQNTCLACVWILIGNKRQDLFQPSSALSLPDHRHHFKMAFIRDISLPFCPKHTLMTAGTMEQSRNSLVSAKPSDSGTTVSLHPLVLLTATDQITRHRVRGETQPVVGILLGQQKGREITAEQAFAAALEKDGAGDFIFKQPWLENRSQQCEFPLRRAPQSANA